MADFPTSPTVGTVYSVDGIDYLCTGANRFKPIAENTVYSTVDAMKLGINPAGHRATCVRYIVSAEPLSGLSYVSRGIGWPVVADGYVNHSDSKGNFLELVLANDLISLDHAGAVKDGITDDAPRLRAAMAHLKARSGGTLYIPAGRYAVNTGDPRGLKITGTNDFYTVCEIANNVTVLGEGDQSVFVYKSDRIGVVPASGNGDVGTLFGNFRVTAASNTPYACSNFHVKLFKVEYTVLSNQAIDWIDGQIVRVYSLAGLVDNGVFTANQVNASSPPGHQVFSYEKVASFESSGCRIFNPGKLSNTSNSDFSAYYITGTRAIIDGNFCTGSTATNDNATFIELHTFSSVVCNNLCLGMNTFLNAVSQTTHPGAAYDYAEYRVHNNHARNIRNFVVDWVAATNRKSSIAINDNYAIFRAASTTDVEKALQHAFINGPSDLPTEIITVKDNYFTVNASGAGTSPVAYETSFDALIRHSHVKNLVIHDNVFAITRRAALVADGAILQTISIKGNEINFGIFGSDIADNSGKASRCGIVVNYSAGYQLAKVYIKYNDMKGLYGGAQANHGIFFLNSGGAVNTKVNICGNEIVGTVSEELGSVVFGGNSYTVDSFDIQHSAKMFWTTSAFASIYPDVGIAALRAGSCIRYLTSAVKVVDTGGSKDFLTESYGTAAPVSGYWSAGSFRHNTAAGVLGWKCEVSGTPGTWVAKA
jgi:hypothetical protein